MQPNYAPNTVNQTVDFGGMTWKGQPGQGWTAMHATGAQAAPDASQAQQTYQQGIGSAVSSLQSAGTSLADKYTTLLGNIMGQGTVAMNTATTGENNLLASRGITNNSPLYSREMTSAQLPVTAQNQAAVGNLGFTEAGLQNNLAQNIAGIQAGGAGTASQLPLQYGQLALQQAANPANIFGAYAAGSQALTGANFISIPNVGVYDIANKKIISSTGLSSTGRTIAGKY